MNTTQEILIEKNGMKVVVDRKQYEIIYSGNLPELKGTEKQVHWADEIREKILNKALVSARDSVETRKIKVAMALERRIVSLDDDDFEDRAEIGININTEIQNLSKIRDSRFWIDNRNNSDSDTVFLEMIRYRRKIAKAKK